MKLTIELKPGATDALLPADKVLAQAAGERVRDCVRSHLTDRSMHTAPNRYGLPHTGYWHEAANTVRVGADGKGVTTVSIGAEDDNPKSPGQGVALHYYGGVVYPTAGRKALAIPISPEVAGKNPREVANLTDGIALVWPKNSGHGFLKDENTNELLWLLVRSATVKADRSVLPEDGKMLDAAMDGIYSRIGQTGRADG